MVVGQLQQHHQEISVALTKIKPGVKYNIMVDAPNPIPDGSIPGPEFHISYNGNPPPPPLMYEEAPILPINW